MDNLKCYISQTSQLMCRIHIYNRFFSSFLFFFKWKQYLYILLHLQKKLNLPLLFTTIMKKRRKFTLCLFPHCTNLYFIKIYLCTKEVFCLFFVFIFLLNCNSSPMGTENDFLSSFQFFIKILSLPTSS